MASAVLQHGPSAPERWLESSEGQFRVVDRTARCEDANDTNSTRDGFEGMIGASEALKRVLDQVRTVATTDSAVLLGAQGTGKGLISCAIHNVSPRSDRNFAKFDCAAIRLGLLEANFSVMRGARSRERLRGRSDALSWQTKARFSWTRSAKSRRSPGDREQFPFKEKRSRAWR
jgi:transcriptional regulator of aromatic amino acid metabolism